MGEIRAKVRLGNALDEMLVRRGQLPADKARVYEADAMVDTGAVRSVIPVHVMEQLGVFARGRRVAEYGDGRQDVVDITEPVIFEILGRDTLEEALVLGDEVLIGQTILEKLDLMADCASGRLLPNPAHPDQPVTKVKAVLAAMVSDRTIVLDVFRYRPDQEQEPTFQSYPVPYHEDWVVLDALNHIKDEVDGTLSFRWSCRMGVCGSCGMMVNGVPKLTCAAFLRDYLPGPIRVEPLANFPVERDLVIVLDDFMHKLQEIQPWIIRDREKPLEEGEYRQTPAELARYKQFSMCINCMLCYAACPVYGLEPSFLGPAAIALAQRYNLDSRDQGRERRQELVASQEGIWECTFVGECSVVCPKHVDPAGAIQQAKISSTLDWFKALLPWGQPAGPRVGESASP